MRRLVTLVTLIGGMVAASVVPATAQPPVRTFSVEELLKVRRVSDPRLSPDGSRVALVVTDVNLEKNTRASHIWLTPTAGGQLERLVVGDQSENTPRWSPDGRQIAFVSARDGSSQVWVADAAPGAMPRKITSMATEASGVMWSPDGKWLLLVSDVFPECDTLACHEKQLKAFEGRASKARVFDGLLFRHWTSWKDGRFSHLFFVPADGSAPPRDLTPGRADVPPFSLGGPDDYAFSPDSKEVAFVRKTDRVEAISTNSDLFVLDLSVPNATPRAITTGTGADGGPAYSPDGRFIAYRRQARAGFEADRWELMLFDRRSSEHRSVTVTFDRQVDSYAWMPDSKALLVVAGEGGEVPVFRVETTGGTPARVLTGGSFGDVQLTADGRRMIFTRSTLHQPAEVYRAAADGSGVAQVTRVNETLMSDYGLRPAESVSYAGAGGVRIQAWIVKPPSFDPSRKYPLLYLVHGGPQGAWSNSWGYRWNPQVFAAAGYVVMMPNPRGSTGFGQQFTDEISGDWGGKAFDDLMKGVDFAETLPYVDSARKGAAGASYGGYMMNWFLGHTTRFKALVSHASVYNLTSMYGATEELWFPEWDLGGTPWTNRAAYEKFSPHMYAQNFKTPTLVTHGELDFRVPIGEGLQLYTTLQRLGVPSKMIYFPDEGHWINRPANSALWYRSFVEWMDNWTR